MDELRAEINALEERMPRPYNKNPELNKERTKLLAKLRRMVAKAAEADDPGTDEDEINLNDPMFKGMTEKEIEAEWESFSEKGGFRGTVESQIHESYPKMKKGHPLFKAIQPEKEPTSAETTSPGKEPTSPEKEPTSAGKKTTAPTVSPPTNVITPRRKKKFRGSPLEGASRTPQRPISAEKKKAKMTTTEKLDCPFCGSHHIRFDRFTSRGKEAKELWSTCCKNCGATFPNRPTTQLLVDKWKRRPQRKL